MKYHRSKVRSSQKIARSRKSMGTAILRSQPPGTRYGDHRPKPNALPTPNGTGSRKRRVPFSCVYAALMRELANRMSHAEIPPNVKEQKKSRRVDKKWKKGVLTNSEVEPLPGERPHTYPDQGTAPHQNHTRPASFRHRSHALPFCYFHQHIVTALGVLSNGSHEQPNPDVRQGGNV